MHTDRVVRPLLLALVLWTLNSTVVFADTFEWDGGGTDNDLATDKNWVGNIKPPSDGTATMRFMGSVRTNPVASSNWELFRIVVPNGEVNEFTLTGASMKIGVGGIFNGSLKTQIVANDLTLVETPPFTGSHIFNADTQDLVLKGNIDMQSFTAEFYGDGAVRLEGTVTGVNGQIEVGSQSVLSSPGHVILSGIVNVDVDTKIGTLTIDTDQPQPPFTTLSFDDGTALKTLGIHSINNRLQLNGHVRYEGNGQLQMDQPISGPGALTVAGTPAALLGLGPVNNFSPFPGDVQVDQGQLELNGSGVVAQLGGTLRVGNASGAAGTAVLRGSVAGMLASGVPLTVESDGLVHLVGPVTFSTLDLRGGDLTVDNSIAVTVEPLNAGGSSRTTTLDARWSMPIGGLDYDLQVSNGSADPDLRMPAGCEGPGTLRINGGGQVELGGIPQDGPGAINVMAGELVLNRAPGPSILTSAGASNSTLRIAANDQLGSGCQLNLLAGSVLDIGGFQENAGRTQMDECQVLGTGTLTLHDDLDVGGDTTIAPTLSFGVSFADVDLFADAVLTTSLVDAANLNILGGGRLVAEEFNGNITLTEGTLVFNGFLDGDFDVFDVLEIPADAGTPVTVNGTATLGSTATLRVILDASGATAGDEFPLLQALQIQGSFSTVELPPPPAGHVWTLEETATEIRLRVLGPVGVDPLPSVPQVADLRIHPTPFNPRTTISFELPTAGPVRVEVFDARGRRVARLEDGPRPAGRFQVPWHGTDGAGRMLSSGVYFIRMSHRDGQLVRRATLLK